MKNIVLIDRGLVITNYILEHTTVHITILIVDEKKQKESYKENKRISCIYTVQEIAELETMDGLNFDIVEKYKDMQISIENALSRFVADYNLRKYYYYIGLAFWHKVFSEHQIDMVLLMGMDHGLLHDGIAKRIAVHQNIPCYTCNAIAGGNGYKCFIYDELRQKIISVFVDNQANDIMDYLKFDNGYDVLNINFDKNERQYDGDFIIRLKQFIESKIYRVSGAMGVEFVRSIKKRKVFSYEYIASTGFKSTYMHKLKCWGSFLLIERKLQSMEQAPDYSDKYIFFPLHMEPEASVQVRLDMECQLVLIKMLSEVLPKGWFVYVKEHPHQYKLNNRMFNYFINNVNDFKTGAFYKKIDQMHNVKIISRKYFSRDLIEHAQGVADTMGSVLLECIILKKPILLCSKMHPLLNDNEILKCFSYQDFNNSIRKIQNGYQPHYMHTLDLLNKYIIRNQSDLFHNVLNLFKKVMSIDNQT